MPALAADEAIVWQGRPFPIMRFGMETMATGIFAVALILACLGLGTVINRAQPGMFWPIFAPGVVLGAVIVFGYPLLQFLKAQRTSYVLTNKRALIIGAGNPRATDGDRNGYSNPKADDLVFVDGDKGTIWFAQRPTGGRSGGRPNMQRVGFERIAGAEQVFDMMQKQAGQHR